MLHKRLFILIVIASVMNSIAVKSVFPIEDDVASDDEQCQEDNESVASDDEQCQEECESKKDAEVSDDESRMEARFRPMQERLRRFSRALNRNTYEINDTVALAHNASNASNRALERTDEFSEKIDTLTERLNTLSGGVDEVEQAKAKKLRARILKDKVKLRQAAIDEKQRRGIYEETAKIKAQASIDAETSKWDKIKEILGDSKPVVNIVLAATALALSVYTIKYGISALVNHVRRPHVISETSKRSWFDFEDAQETTDFKDIDDLIFNPVLKKQLFELAVRIKSAKMFSENLPNILFYGVPGTGKTAFVRALAHYSGLDYALTSGSEFAKITNLNTANNELRNLLDWANNTENGLIVFIDEAQSLFANTKLPTTPKKTQDFINTFLSLIPDKSQKNVMFVFATNNPFMLDDAMTSRIGISIEMPLPDAPEREKILDLYLKKFAQENEEALVAINPEVMQALPSYAEHLKGLSPRAIKFVAEEMIVAARRQMPHQLTNTIAQKVLTDAKQNLNETKKWEQERERWLKTHTVH